MYDDMYKMKMEYFTKDRMFPFYIQYGFHEESMYLHVHDSFSELVIVLNGSAKHIVNDEEFYISQGDVFIIGSDTFHGYQDTQDFLLDITQDVFLRLSSQPQYSISMFFDYKRLHITLSLQTCPLVRLPPNVAFRIVIIFRGSLNSTFI